MFCSFCLDYHFVFQCRMQVHPRLLFQHSVPLDDCVIPHDNTPYMLLINT